MIRCIAQYLENQTSLVVGTTLYVGHRPNDAAANCVTLLERVPGKANPMTPSQIQKPIQLLTRNEGYTAGRAAAMAAYNALFGRDNAGYTLPELTSGETWFVNIATGTEPAFIGRGPDGLFEFSCNLVLKISAI